MALAIPNIFPSAFPDICLEPETQGCGMTFNRFYVGSKHPYFISYRGKWMKFFLPQLCTPSSTIEFIASQMQKRPQFLILSSSLVMANISPISAGRCQNGKIMSSNWATTLHLLPGFKCIFYRSSQEWYFLERKK